jgi:hypothetical protein
MRRDREKYLGDLLPLSIRLLLRQGSRCRLSASRYSTRYNRLAMLRREGLC